MIALSSNNERAFALTSFAEANLAGSTILMRAIRSAIAASVHNAAKGNHVEKGAVLYTQAISEFSLCLDDPICFLHSLRAQSVYAQSLQNSQSPRTDALVAYSKMFNAVNDRFGNATLLSAAISLMIGHIYYQDSSYQLSYQSYEEAMQSYKSAVSQLNRRTDRRNAHHSLAVVQSIMQLEPNTTFDTVTLLSAGIHSYTESLRSSGSLPALTLYDWLGECYSVNNNWDDALLVWREGWMTCRKRLGDDDNTSRAWNRRVAAHYARIEKKRDDEKKLQLERERQRREAELKKRADEAAAAAAREAETQKRKDEEMSKSDL